MGSGCLSFQQVAFLVQILLCVEVAHASWCQVPEAGSGWQHVRHTSGSQWHPSQDRLLGTDKYGTPSTSPDAPAWSIPYKDEPHNQFLFMSVNCEVWLVAEKFQVHGERYGQRARTVLKSSASSEPYTAVWRFGRVYASEPAMTLRDWPTEPKIHLANGATADFSRYRGFDVFIRQVPSCADQLQNGEEQAVDCGGPLCPPCRGSCTDGLKNDGESEVDCGGECGPCDALTWSRPGGTSDRPRPRYKPAMCGGGNTLFVGFGRAFTSDGDVNHPDTLTLADWHKYDALTDSWTDLSEKADFKALFPLAHMGWNSAGSCVVVDSVVYLYITKFNGNTATGHNYLMKFEVQSETWSTWRATSADPANMGDRSSNAGRYGLPAGAILGGPRENPRMFAIGTNLYLKGGSNGWGAMHTWTYKLELTTGAIRVWDKVSPFCGSNNPVFTEKANDNCGTGAFRGLRYSNYGVLGDTVYFTLSYSLPDETTGTLVSYKPEEPPGQRWAIVDTSQHSGTPPPFFTHNMMVIGFQGSLYIHGGYFHSPLGYFAKFDPSNATWTDMSDLNGTRAPPSVMGTSGGHSGATLTGQFGIEGMYLFGEGPGVHPLHWETMPPTRRKADGIVGVLWRFGERPDFDECAEGTHNCAPWAECTNLAETWNCSCDAALFDSCIDNYPCNSTIQGTNSLTIMDADSEEGGPPSETFEIWNDGVLTTHLHAVALLQFTQLPPVELIGRATLRLDKEANDAACSKLVIQAAHADFISGAAGAGVRRFHPFDPPVQQGVAVPMEAGEVLLDVTAVLRNSTGASSLLLADPENCRLRFASTAHPDAARRPVLEIQWVSDECTLNTQPAGPGPDTEAFFMVPEGTVAEVRSECNRRGGVLAAIASEEDNVAAAAACSSLPCFVELPSLPEPQEPPPPPEPEFQYPPYVLTGLVLKEAGGAGRTFKYDRGADRIRLNSGEDMTFDVMHPPRGYASSAGYVGLKHSSESRYMRHAGYVLRMTADSGPVYDFAWKFIDNNDGTFKIFNDYSSNYYLTYRSSTDEVLIQQTGLGVAMRFVVEAPGQSVEEEPVPQTAAVSSFAPRWVSGNPQEEKDGAALWTADGFWHSVSILDRLPGLCRVCLNNTYLDDATGACRPCAQGSAPSGASDASQCEAVSCAVDPSAPSCTCPSGWRAGGGGCGDIDECEEGTHNCMTDTDAAQCLSGLTHWYKLAPESPLADSQGGTPLAQMPDVAADENFIYSQLACPGKFESCAHWSPQPTPALENSHEPNNLRWQILLDDFVPTTGLTVTFWYKRWSTNKFGPRQRDLLCLKNGTAVDDPETNQDQCVWSLSLTSALYTHLATQVLELKPSGFFSLSEINILDINRWYMIGLVVSTDNTVRLYIDYAQVGPTLFLEWDPTLYQSPNALEMQVIQMEGRADIKVFNQALTAEQLSDRFAYVQCAVNRCTNTVGAFVCSCDSGFRLENGVCAKTDACSLGTHNCKDPAVCSAGGDGAYECLCPEGTAATSLFTCAATDACTTGEDTCHGFATCTASETVGDYECECAVGWIGDGSSCRSIDSTEHYVAIAPSADGWIQPWPEGALVEEVGTSIDSSFVLSYLAIGAGSSKNLRMVLQFDHLPAGVSQANLELTHLWRRDPNVCGAFTMLKFAALDADVSEFLGQEASTRRLEEIPGVTFVTYAPNQGRETGRVVIDITPFVQQAAPNGGRFAFSVLRDPTADQVCDDWFSSSNAGSSAGPWLHLAYREQREAAMDSWSTLEPTLDASISIYDADSNTHEYEHGGEDLRVGQHGQVAVLQFDGVPSDVSAASLVLSESAAFAADSPCADRYMIGVVSNEIFNGTFTTTTDTGAGWYPVAVHQVRRLSVLDVTDVVQRHATGGSLGLVLAVNDTVCGSNFRSSRYIPTSHYAKVNPPLSDRPRLELQHRQACGDCVFELSPESTLTRADDVADCPCQALGFPKLAITGISPTAFGGFSALERLDLSSNNIKEVRVETLMNLTALRVLDLSENAIEWIEEGAFAAMPDLEELYLQRNSLVVLARNRFVGLSNLLVLLLSRNRIRYVELGAFAGLERLVWLDMSHNQQETIDTSVFESMESLEAVSMADSDALACVPVFPETVVWADLTVLNGGLRFFKLKPICLPYDCPPRPDLLLFSTAAFFLGDDKPFHGGLEEVMSLIRPDAAGVLDRAHRELRLHVARGAQKRCVCDGSAFCIEAPQELLVEGAACAEDNQCASERCCGGLCAALDQLDHRGAGGLCAGEDFCLDGFESRDGFRTCVDVDECGTRADNCDEERAACINTLGSFQCQCEAGWESDGAVQGVACVDVNECERQPSICAQNVEEALRCENTEGSFVCNKVIPVFEEVSIMHEELFPPPRRWRRSSLSPRRNRRVPARIQFPPYVYPEREGAFVVMLAFEMVQQSIMETFYTSFGARRSQGSFPYIAGTAVDLQPHDTVLDGFAEIEVPVAEGAFAAADEFLQVLRVHHFDYQTKLWSVVETLGLTPTGTALRARIDRFGTYVVIGICRAGARTSDPNFLPLNSPLTCELCPAGSYSSEGAAECTPCAPGEYAPAGSDACVVCPANHVPLDSDGPCVPCDVGTFALVGDATCTDCGAADLPDDFECTCDEGLIGLSSPCTEADECRVGTHNCDDDATCEKRVGGYSCSCNSGFSWDGNRCIDDDECSDGQPCGDDAICRNIPGSYSCACPGDFAGDGMQCSQLPTTPSEQLEEVQECEEKESDICHFMAYCDVAVSRMEVPSGEAVVEAGVNIPQDSDGSFSCACPPEMLGHGYGANGCSDNGFTVRVVYRDKDMLTEAEVETLLSLIGGLSCVLGSLTSCDHLHFTQHGPDRGVNVLFPTEDAATAAAASFNSFASLRRDDTFPVEVDAEVGARVYTWSSDSMAVAPTGMAVQSVQFEPTCGATGCWVLGVTYTTGSREDDPQSFNTFFLPYAVGSDQLSYDYRYAENGILDSFQPANFPCRVSDYVADDGSVTSLPVRATGCCFGSGFDENVTALGGDGTGQGVLGNYRTTEAFAAYAAVVYPELCPGGGDAPALVTTGPEDARTRKPQDLFPDGSGDGAHTASDFLAEGQKFVGMPNSPGVTASQAVDAFIGQYTATIKVDAKELRTLAGLLRGTVGVEHTVDFFLGFADFKPATGTWILDSFATQAAVHVEQTSLFSVSTHGTNDYTFLEYVNLRLVAVYNQSTAFDSDPTFSIASGAAQYLQVTFTLGSQYVINSNSGLIPLDSVLAGRGTFPADTPMHHKCLEYMLSPDNEFDSPATVSRFNETLRQTCGPGAAMCVSPSAIPDSFVSFNIPLGIDFLREPSATLDNNVFVELVVSAVDDDARSDNTDPNAGQAPWQMKTTLSASIPVVEGGVNTFCDGVTAATDLKDVADVDIIVGSASSLAELSRLRIVTDAASTELNAASVEINSDSIEAGLMTLVVRGNASYFDNPSQNTRGVSLELEDVITVHIMEADGVAADGDGSQGKQGEIKTLLAQTPDDAPTIPGNGFALNGAFYFTVDRAAQRAHLEPSPALLAACPFNPQRPEATGVAVLETCVTRRDVRYRDYPWRAGGMSTAMEVSADAFETPLATTSVESRFMTTILGDSNFARSLAVDYASTIDEVYDLNGRFRRAFWVNPGYEWTPTQTGGSSLFQLSQRLFLFALVTIDERIASSPGSSIFNAAQYANALEDTNDDGSSETVANLPRVPSLSGGGRRMLLSVDPAAGDGAAMSSAELSFAVTRASALAAAFGVPLSHVATFAVKLQLAAAQACMGLVDLQQELQVTLRGYVKRTASAVKTVQLLSVTPTGGSGCDSRRASSEKASADVDMAVVFDNEESPSFDVASFSRLPNVQEVTFVSVSNVVATTEVPTRSWPDETDAEPKSSLSVAVIAGACAGGAVVVLGLGCAVMWYRRRSASLHLWQRQESPLSHGLSFADLAVDVQEGHKRTSTEELLMQRGSPVSADKESPLPAGRDQAATDVCL